MSYQTFKTELTAASAAGRGLAQGIVFTNKDIEAAQAIKTGLLDTIMIPNRIKMSEYINARVNYLNGITSSHADFSTGAHGAPAGENQFEWRSPVTHSTLNDTDVYGAEGTHTALIDNWTIEKWCRYRKSQTGPGFGTYTWAACAAHGGEYGPGASETFSDISATSISQAGISGTVHSFTVAATGWSFGMKWIHLTPNPSSSSETYYDSTLGAFGIDFQIATAAQSVETTQTFIDFYNTLTELDGQY